MAEALQVLESGFVGARDLGIRSSVTTVVGANRVSLRCTGRSGLYSSAAMAQKSAQASSASLARGPMVSRVVDSATAPEVGMRPSVVLRPTTPLTEAGMRTLPPVSDPTAHAAK